MGDVRGAARHEEANAVGAVLLDDVRGVDHVASRLAHLATVRRLHEAVAEDCAGQRQAHGHEHTWPDDAVEPRDVLADDVHAGGPEAGVGAVGPVHATEVVGERVEPHVHDMLWFVGHGHAPVERRARDAKVEQRLAEALEDLGAPDGGLDKLWVGVDVLEQPRLVPATKHKHHAHA